MQLQDFFKEHTKAAIAFSGGVDSAYLLYAAERYAQEVCAYYVKTPFQPLFEWEDAKRLTDELGILLRCIELDILTDESVVSNPQDRCYFCKKRIFSAIADAAKQDGFSVLLDGTNASDDEGDRPGMKALRELSVLSPLRLCGLSKKDIRALSKEAGLFTWNKPAYACLATRIPAGQPITLQSLRRTEEAESFLFSLGFLDFRIRTVGEDAKIQIASSQLPMLIEHRNEILAELKKRYQSVLLDLEMRDEH